MRVDVFWFKIFPHSFNNFYLGQNMQGLILWLSATNTLYCQSWHVAPDVQNEVWGQVKHPHALGWLYEDTRTTIGYKCCTHWWWLHHCHLWFTAPVILSSYQCDNGVHGTTAWMATLSDLHILSQQQCGNWLPLSSPPRVHWKGPLHYNL